MLTQSVGQSPGTFVDNMSLPVHRWYRYSAGFGGQWAEEVISQEAGNPDALVFDPFAGSGTALIASEQRGIKSWGMDSHPFVARVAKAKLAYRSSQAEYMERAGRVLERAKQRTPSLESYGALMRRCYSDVALGQLDCIRAEVEDARDTSEACWYG